MTPISGVTTWLLALAMVVSGGLAMTGAAALLAMVTGLPADRALRLVTDPRASPLVSSATWVAATIVVTELGVAVALFIALRRLRLRLQQVVPLTPPRAAETLGALLLVFGIAPLAELAAEVVQRHVSQEVTSEQTVQALAQSNSSAGFVLALLVAATLPSLAEEALCRGLIFGAFERHGALVTVTVTSLLFGALHLNPSDAAGSAVLGVAFGLARWQTRSVTPALFAHAIYNGVVIAAERFAPAADARAVSFWHVTIGMAAACFGFWLLGQRSSRPETL